MAVCWQVCKTEAVAYVLINEIDCQRCLEELAQGICWGVYPMPEVAEALQEKIFSKRENINYS